MLRRPLNAVVKRKGSKTADDKENGFLMAGRELRKASQSANNPLRPAQKENGQDVLQASTTDVEERIERARLGMIEAKLPAVALSSTIASEIDATTDYATTLPSSGSLAAPAEHVLLEEWSFAFNGSRPLQLTGRVFNNAAGFEDGDTLEYTSQIVQMKGRVATTKSGTTYYLGRPAPEFEQLRKQLWLCSRSGALGRDDGSSVPSIDIDQPLEGIKLGEVVPCAPVRLPKVVGWSHQSGIAVSIWQSNSSFLR